MSKISVVKLAEDDRLYASALLSVYIPGNEEEVFKMNDLITVMGTNVSTTHVRIEAEKIIIEKAFDKKMKDNEFLKSMQVSFLVKDPDNELKTKNDNKCFVMGIDYHLLQNWYIGTQDKKNETPKQIKDLFDVMFKELNHPELIIKGSK